MVIYGGPIINLSNNPKSPKRDWDARLRKAEHAIGSY
jgi:hypothetical protein